MSASRLPVRRALISLSDKTGAVEFATFLASQQVEILSTGGTAALLREAGIVVKDVSEYTGFPEMLDGRVKTLHPAIHGGLLGKRDDAAHQTAMQAHAIAPIDLVAITLYPFEATVARGASKEECIENIDIGGPSMIRSAAKNHRDVVVITDPSDYAGVQAALTLGGTDAPLRRALAGKAYARTAAYDAAISQWFAAQYQAESGEAFPATLSVVMPRKQGLRYGENPHQAAAFYAMPQAAAGVASATQLQGKELSYNNINDTDAAFELVREFNDPAVAIIKHANPCGVAVGESLSDAYRKALACDPVSAFGGIIAVNRPLDAATAEQLTKLFVEVVIAPAVEDEARAYLASKKNVRVLVTGPIASETQTEWVLRSVRGGLLVQTRDAGLYDIAQQRVVTRVSPDATQMKDLLFAFAVAKHVKSNAIVLAANGATIGIGAGQMSRIDSTRIAGWKASEAKLPTQGAVLASDAFFPFADNVERAAEMGIRAIIQPGGSIRDDEVIAAADQHGIAMVFTGQRHFRH